MPWYFNIEFNNIQSVNRLWYLKLKRMWYNLPFIFNLARLCIRQGRQGVGPKSQGWIYMDPQDQVQQWPDEQGVVPHGPRSQRPSQDPKDFRLGPSGFQQGQGPQNPGEKRKFHVKARTVRSGLRLTVIPERQVLRNQCTTDQHLNPECFIT